MMNRLRSRIFVFLLILAVCSLAFFWTRYSQRAAFRNALVQSAVEYVSDGDNHPTEVEPEELSEIVGNIEGFQQEFDTFNQDDLVGFLGSLFWALGSAWGVLEPLLTNQVGIAKLQETRMSLENEKLACEIEKLRAEIAANSTGPNISN